MRKNLSDAQFTPWKKVGVMGLKCEVFGDCG